MRGNCTSPPLLLENVECRETKAEGECPECRAAKNKLLPGTTTVQEQSAMWKNFRNTGSESGLTSSSISNRLKKDYENAQKRWKKDPDRYDKRGLPDNKSLEDMDRNDWEVYGNKQYDTRASAEIGYLYNDQTEPWGINASPYRKRPKTSKDQRYIEVSPAPSNWEPTSPPAPSPEASTSTGLPPNPPPSSDTSGDIAHNPPTSQQKGKHRAENSSTSTGKGKARANDPAKTTPRGGSEGRLPAPDFDTDWVDPMDRPQAGSSTRNPGSNALSRPLNLASTTGGRGLQSGFPLNLERDYRVEDFDADVFENMPFSPIASLQGTPTPPNYPTDRTPPLVRQQPALAPYAANQLSTQESRGRPRHRQQSQPRESSQQRQPTPFHAVDQASVQGSGRSSPNQPRTQSHVRARAMTPEITVNTQNIFWNPAEEETSRQTNRRGAGSDTNDKTVGFVMVPQGPDPLNFLKKGATLPPNLADITQGKKPHYPSTANSNMVSVKKDFSPSPTPKGAGNNSRLQSTERTRDASIPRTVAAKNASPGPLTRSQTEPITPKIGASSINTPSVAATRLPRPIVQQQNAPASKCASKSNTSNRSSSASPHPSTPDSKSKNTDAKPNSVNTSIGSKPSNAPSNMNSRTSSPSSRPSTPSAQAPATRAPTPTLQPIPRTQTPKPTNANHKPSGASANAKNVLPVNKKPNNASVKPPTGGSSAKSKTTSSKSVGKGVSSKKKDDGKSKKKK